MRIPDNKIDEIRTASDIVDVISTYVSLKKRGKNFLGLCPFHQEKTPSFNVSPEKQMYHCFGCGVGGNVFTFVMELEKVSFIEAVRTLADRAGIALPSEGSDDRGQTTENEALYHACRIAGLFFNENLTATTEGKLTLEYFRHRGFTDDTIRSFGLGYSMPSWDALVRRGERDGLDFDVLEKAGLIMKRDDGSGFYDRFRGRAMFPIFSSTGRPIAFGARKMREDDPLGKYINSPETPIYNKSRVLYGLSLAKETIREKDYAIVVEGYADLISVFQAGIRNIVASSGTALTEEQVQLVGRYTRNITMVYDADSAGSKATIRGVDLIIENGLDVKVAELPQGDDPDSFVKKHGGAAFQKLLDDASSFLDFKIGTFRAQGLLETPEGNTQAVRSIVETIGKMRDELKRAFWMKRVSEKYGIYEPVLFRELEKIVGREKSPSQRVTGTTPGKTGTRTRPLDTPPVSEQPIPVMELDLIRAMLEKGGTMVRFVLANIDLETLTDERTKRVVRILAEKGDSGWDANSILDELQDEDVKRIIAESVANKYEISNRKDLHFIPQQADPWELAGKAIVRLREQELIKQRQELKKELDLALLRGEDVIQYNQQINALYRQQKELETNPPLPPKGHN